MEELKLIVAGGRDFAYPDLLACTINEFADGKYKDYAVSIVSGKARGADMLAYQFAVQNNIKVYSFPADWASYGKGAGFRRNEEMGRFADALVAFWDGQSRGTEHMIKFMKSLGKPVDIIRY